MDVDVGYDEATAICTIRVTGWMIGRDATKDYFSSALPTLEKHACSRVLFDMRGAEWQPDTGIFFHLGAEPEAWGWKRTYKAAAVYRRITNDERFLENVAVNRGYMLRVFEDEDEAIAWLLTGQGAGNGIDRGGG